VHLPGNLPFDFRSLDRISISACGTAYYAGVVAKYWFEQFARLPVEIDVASEFRYREVPLKEGGLSLVVSQSGETADTLATLRCAKGNKQHTVAVVNVLTSTIARESDAVMPTLADPEIGVASTKAFTCQPAVLAALALAAHNLAKARDVLYLGRGTNCPIALWRIHSRCFVPSAARGAVWNAYNQDNGQRTWRASKTSFAQPGSTLAPTRS
jgi:glucosamine 6-phosphate synthetase-like amidotransferase/phosphosugar isomerase protein